MGGEGALGGIEKGNEIKKEGGRGVREVEGNLGWKGGGKGVEGIVCSIRLSLIIYRHFLSENKV